MCAWNPWHLAVLYALVGVAAPLIGVAVPLAAAALVQTAVALRQPVRRRGGRFAVAALVVVSAGAVWAVLTYGLLAVLLISWPD